MDDPRKQGPQQGPIDWSEFIKQAQQSGAGADFNKIKSRFSHLKKRTIIIAAVVLYVLPEALRQFADLRMLVYAIVLILVMLATNNPQMRGLVGKIIPRRKGAAVDG